MPTRKTRKLETEKPLTGRQQAFVRWYTTPGPTLFNATRSCEKSGYSGKDALLARQGHENLRKPKIQAAIRAVWDEQFDSADLSIARVLTDIEVTRQLALADGKYSAALQCSIAHGKYLKMWIDKVEHVITMDDVSLDDLYTLANRLAGKIDGLNLNGAAGTDGAGGGSDDGPAGDRTTH